jgi:hypothetical protein
MRKSREDPASPEQLNSLQPSAQAFEWSSLLRLQPSLTRQPIRLEPLVVLLEFWLGLASDIVCLDPSGLRALRSASSAICCAADRFGWII